MNRRIGVLGGLVALGVAVVGAGIGYWAGTMAATGGRLVAGPYPYYYGFHFFPFFGLFWLLLIGLLLFALFRGFGRWGYRGGHWHGGPSGLSDWHKQQHEGSSGGGAGSAGGSSTGPGSGQVSA